MTVVGANKTTCGTITGNASATGKRILNYGMLISRYTSNKGSNTTCTGNTGIYYSQIMNADVRNIIIYPNMSKQTNIVGVRTVDCQVVYNKSLTIIMSGKPCSGSRSGNRHPATTIIIVIVSSQIQIFCLYKIAVKIISDLI